VTMSKEQNTELSPPVDRMLYGALLGLVAWLTTREKSITVGSSRDCCPLLAALEEWATLNNLQIPKPSEDWREELDALRTDGDWRVSIEELIKKQVPTQFVIEPGNETERYEVHLNLLQDVKSGDSVVREYRHYGGSGSSLFEAFQNTLALLPDNTEIENGALWVQGLEPPVPYCREEGAAI